jgi:hypothetical protein
MHVGQPSAWRRPHLVDQLRLWRSAGAGNAELEERLQRIFAIVSLPPTDPMLKDEAR